MGQWVMTHRCKYIGISDANIETRSRAAEGDYRVHAYMSILLILWLWINLQFKIFSFKKKKIKNDRTSWISSHVILVFTTLTLETKSLQTFELSFVLLWTGVPAISLTMFRVPFIFFKKKSWGVLMKTICKKNHR
jgi:hypothetical protein